MDLNKVFEAAMSTLPSPSQVKSKFISTTIVYNEVDSWYLLKVFFEKPEGPLTKGAFYKKFKILDLGTDIYSIVEYARKSLPDANSTADAYFPCEFTYTPNSREGDYRVLFKKDEVGSNSKWNFVDIRRYIEYDEFGSADIILKEYFNK